MTTLFSLTPIRGQNMSIINRFREIVEKVLAETGVKYHRYITSDKMYSIFFYTHETPEEKINEVIDKIRSITDAQPKIVTTIGKVYLDYVVQETYKPVDIGEVKRVCSKYHEQLVHKKTIVEGEGSVPKACTEKLKPVTVVRKLGKFTEEKYTGKKIAYCEGRKKAYIIILHEDRIPKPLYEIYFWDKSKSSKMPELKQIIDKIT